MKVGLLETKKIRRVLEVTEAEKYLGLIGEHLFEHHAAVLVGAGFSRNALKKTSETPSSPSWKELAEIFADKLDMGSGDDASGYVSPLVLAERVEAVYGRQELNDILRSSIRDQDYLPSPLHRKLLQLPWSDIFTTNYDTLLERAGETISEETFVTIRNKEDLLGSSGKMRIVKLHGSFPSQYPFIITSEDYRTYPQKFAPFVNTVQQSILENTLCLIGFSGDDPNFEKWIGWIRDNLGEENAPNVYLLLHHQLPEADKLLLRRKKIVPVDLSQLAPGEPVDLIYEKALRYLEKKVEAAQPQKWGLVDFVERLSNEKIEISEAVKVLREIHEAYPGWITVPSEQLQSLRTLVLPPAERILVKCSEKAENSAIEEMEYLYEYDWLREKALKPPFAGELKCYQKILGRHLEDSLDFRASIQISLLRNCRENGNWSEWDELHECVANERTQLQSEQVNRLCWEECLCAFSKYRFCELKEKLERWDVLPSESTWCLRKAGLLAEYGDIEQAQRILQQAICDIRCQILAQKKTNLSLLSQESALMVLKNFVSQAVEMHTKPGGNDGDKSDESKEAELIDKKHDAVHAQHHVDWEKQNGFFASRMEAIWEPFQTHRENQSFDFGTITSQTVFSEDKEVLWAFAFLRFREETGIPFRIRNVHYNPGAACGAAKRIAQYTPVWSVLTLVRSNMAKEVENVITRGVLSAWSPEEANQQCEFCIEAVKCADDELSPGDYFFHNSFARLSAEVLPEYLSELCSKCSSETLNRVFDLMKTLYSSKNRLCYSRLPTLAKRTLGAYSICELKNLLPDILEIPLPKDEDAREQRCIPDPIEFMSKLREGHGGKPDEPMPAIEKLLRNYQPGSSVARGTLNRLLYCLDFGLLTLEQKEKLRDFLWKNGKLNLPHGWLRTICCDLPEPPGISWADYLAESIKKDIAGYAGNGERPANDIAIVSELEAVSIKYPNAFSEEQLFAVLEGVSARVSNLSHNLHPHEDLMGIKSVSKQQLYKIQNALWLLVSANQYGRVSKESQDLMEAIIKTTYKAGVAHFGLRNWWHQHIGLPFDADGELQSCLCSADEQRAVWGYITLAFAIRQKHLQLLGDEQIAKGITIMAHQISCCVPKQLPSALQVAQLIVEKRLEMLSPEEVDLILIGLSQLLEQSIITPDDTVSAASSKSEVRTYAAALAKSLYHSDVVHNRLGVLEKWMDVIHDPAEYVEIRAV